MDPRRSPVCQTAAGARLHHTVEVSNGSVHLGSGKFMFLSNKSGSINSSENKHVNVFLWCFHVFPTQLAVSSLLREAVLWLVGWSVGRLMSRTPWCPTGRTWHSTASIPRSSAASLQLRPALMGSCRHQTATLVNPNTPFQSSTGSPWKPFNFPTFRYIVTPDFRDFDFIYDKPTHLKLFFCSAGCMLSSFIQLVESELIHHLQVFCSLLWIFCI